MPNNNRNFERRKNTCPTFDNFPLFHVSDRVADPVAAMSSSDLLRAASRKLLTVKAAEAEAAAAAASESPNPDDREMPEFLA